MSSGVQVELIQTVIQKNARSGAALPVHEPNVFSNQILNAFDAFGIPPGDHESLIPENQLDPFDRNVRQEFSNIGKVISIRLPYSEGGSLPGGKPLF